MIIIIDNNSGIAYTSSTLTGAAAIIGVHPQTVSKWADKSRVEKYNRYTIHFEVTEVKCKKGFALNYENIYTISRT